MSHFTIIGQYSYDMADISRDNSLARHSASPPGGTFRNRTSLTKKLSMRFRKSPAGERNSFNPTSAGNIYANSTCFTNQDPIQAENQNDNNIPMDMYNSPLNQTMPNIPQKKPFKLPDFLKRTRAKSTTCSPNLHVLSNRINVIPQISIEAPKLDVACQYSSKVQFCEIGTQTSQNDSPPPAAMGGRCGNRRKSSLIRQSRHKQLSNSDSEDPDIDSKDGSLNSENDNQVTSRVYMPSPSLWTYEFFVPKWTCYFHIVTCHIIIHFCLCWGRE